jgi:hypothetical protein
MKIVIDASTIDRDDIVNNLYSTSIKDSTVKEGAKEEDKEGYKEEDEGGDKDEDKTEDDEEEVDEGGDIFEEQDTIHNGIFYMCLFNNFMIHHNNTNATTKHMFDGIDYKDDTSTTFTMESFYRTMTTYNDNKTHNPKKLKLVDPTNDYELSDATDMYCLKVDNNIHYYCQDIFALLVDVTEKKYGNWKIDTLR